MSREKIAEFAKECIALNDDFHDFRHISKTAEYAVWLAKKENADEEACWAAAMLHDICKNQPGDHGTKGAIEAKKFLLENGFDAAFANSVADAIHFHNKNFSGGSIERGILWDADKLQSVIPDDFKGRLVPFWVLRLGKEEGTKKAISEYYFYIERFHTATAKKEVEKCRKQMEEEIAKLRH